MPCRAGVQCLCSQSRRAQRRERVVLLVSGGVGQWPPRSVPGGGQRNHLPHVDSRRLQVASTTVQHSQSSSSARCAESLSWNKTAGGDAATWVGFELLHGSHQLGVSQRWAEWFVRWTKEVAHTTWINMSSFEEGLGRIMYWVFCWLGLFFTAWLVLFE